MDFEVHIFKDALVKNFTQEEHHLFVGQWLIYSSTDFEPVFGVRGQMAGHKSANVINGYKAKRNVYLK